MSSSKSINGLVAHGVNTLNDSDAEDGVLTKTMNNLMNSSPFSSSTLSPPWRGWTTPELQPQKETFQSLVDETAQPTCSDNGKVNLVNGVKKISDFNSSIRDGGNVT